MDNWKTVLDDFCHRHKVKEAAGLSSQKSLQVLVQYLLNGRLVDEICTTFGAHLYPLLEVAVEPVVVKKIEDHSLKLFVLLGRLVPRFSDAHKFALSYFAQNPPPFQPEEGLLPPAKKKKPKMIEALSVVQATYNMVLVEKDISQGWDWCQFLQHMTNSNSEVRWLACETLALVFNMSESQKADLVSGHIPVEEYRTFILKQLQQPHLLPKTDSLPHEDMRFTDKVTSVAGIDLPVADKSLATKGCLVPVESAVNNLRSLALAVAENAPVLIQGPVGSGKTSLVDHLAMITGRHNTPKYTKIQLGDQTDSKVLVGTYRCTDVPGEFVWQAGVLAQAVSEGHWILLEDVDYASMDVLSVLVPVLESRTLLVPGHGESIKAAPGFQMFLTQRLLSGVTGLYKQHVGQFHIVERYLRKIHVEPLSKAELKVVIETKHPMLKTIVDRILEVFYAVAPVQDGADFSIALKSRDSRLVSTRDLLKWCHRMSENFDVQSPVSQHNAFQDAMDVFCGSVIKSEARLPVAEIISGKLNILKAKAEFYVNSHKPSVDVDEKRIVVGRAALTVRENKELYKRVLKSTFSFTRQATILLERVAVCIRNNEPVLLVGETGCGKTSTVQYLSRVTHHPLTVLNMNQQSDSTDLLGGYKPVEIRHVVAPVRDAFEELFVICFNRAENSKFLGHVMRTFCNQKWTDLFTLMLHSQKAAVKKFKDDASLVKQWEEIGNRIVQLKAQVKHIENALAFAFVEGSLVKAVKNGDWILLDEINLASAETLECLSSLLEGEGSSLALLEKGEMEPIKIHPDFRLFACMNPATDVGKKDLPPGIRNRFTEYYVDEVVNEVDLQLLVGDYLRSLSITSTQVDGIVKFYLHIRGEALRSLEDGTGHKPHYSLRTLCRALAIGATNCFGSVPRSLYEAFCLSFLTQLDRKSHPIVEEMIAKNVLGKKNLKAITSQPIPQPLGGQYIEVEKYWIEQGPNEPQTPDDYIVTRTVRDNLRDIARIVSASRHPVLLQGETSVGKTSLIVYLARLTGNSCVRVNNHEHTDIQEYVGSYTADESGKLVFKEGVLVQAMRKGHWIILDELNLAPSDVLEALNRVLDENRELFIPETQETVTAHPRFQVFATQNPPGQYGGRKVLSRAFRNRFVELHFDEIPTDELETILNQRCQLPLSYAKKLVAVHKELQMHRRGSAAFAGKSGFITLRDLFRWADRYRHAEPPTTKLYDWDQHMVDEGYLVLAGKVRKPEETGVIKEALHKHMKRAVDEEKLFTLSLETSSVTKSILEQVIKSTPKGFEHIVWTFETRRLAVLVGKSFSFKEPVLLVGETGCGKTTISQLFAALSSAQLYAVNCHQHSEASDFLGGLRPVRQRSEDDSKLKLFEWVDGPLVHAMRGGHVFLSDEISLADDSVLERLNSVLESERTLLLAERGSEGGVNPDAVLTAADGFRFVGTMNPGGDYGKKELSPALRNRFTEIWCPLSRKREDLIAIVEHNLKEGVFLSNQQDGSTGIGKAIMDFVEWFSVQELGKKTTFSIRDILSWVSFVNAVSLGQSEEASPILDVGSAYIHGGCLVFLDGLGAGATSTENLRAPRQLRTSAVAYLANQISSLSGHVIDVSNLIGDYTKVHIVSDDTRFGIAPFFITRGPANTERNLFKFQAPTTATNVVRVFRGLQLAKPILLEGSPGVGKTSLVEAMAKAAGFELVRINLSEQTDVSDLFGADLPVEGGVGGQFAWRDGPLLQALKAGHWIVLDELNLASQSVLEGLNAVLDHRGELYIPELGRSFQLDPKKTKLFACQNPQRQGGARKGLPKSFLNRFTQVHVEPLLATDLEFILKALFNIPHDIIDKMIEFNSRLQHEILELNRWGQKGGPWELNLRDMFRWCEAISKRRHVAGASTVLNNPGDYVKLIYADRMRTSKDKEMVVQVYQEVFGSDHPYVTSARKVFSNKRLLQVGNGFLERCQDSAALSDSHSDLLLLHRNLESLESVMHCVEMNWMSILVGPHAAGKSSLVSALAQMTGHPLHVLSMNSSMDTTELLGGFEQSDLARHLEDVASEVKKQVDSLIRCHLIGKKYDLASSLLQDYKLYIQLVKNVRPKNITEETNHFLKKIEALRHVLRDISSPDILRQLEELRLKVEKQRVVSGGGSFEWVDSLLVKALRDGHWLMIDNVNFCGASVLDRLNALLEPNGVLVISERGIIDGQIPTIKPHKDFRLFLAMDPQNGEISRAMRNRGVEIYVLGPEEGSPYTEVEIRSLLNNKGLSSQSVQDALMKFHDDTVEIASGTEKPSIIQLLQASALVVQLLQRSWTVADALMFACADIYVRSQRNQQTKNRVKESLGNACAEWKKLDFGKKGLYDTLGGHCIVSCRTLRCSSTLTRIIQDSTLLSVLGYEGSLQGINLSQLKTYQEFVILNFFHLSTESDIPLRIEYLKKSPEFRQFVQTLEGHLKLVAGPSDVPLDSRLKSPLSRYAKQGFESANRVVLWMQYCCLQWREEVRLKEDRKKVTVHSIVRGIKEGRLSAESSPHPIFPFISPLLSLIDSAFDALLRNTQFLPSNEDWVAVMETVRWRFNFGQLLSLEVSKKSLDVVVSRIGQFWKWLDENLLSRLEDMASLFRLSTKKLQDIAEKFRLTFKSHDATDFEFIAKFLDRYGRPQPFKTVEEAEQSDKAISLAEKLSLPDPSQVPGDKTFGKKMLFLLSEQGEKVCQVLSGILAGNHPEVQNALSDIEAQLAEAQLLSTRPSDLEPTTLPILTILQVQTLPLSLNLWQRQQALCLNSDRIPTISSIIPTISGKWNEFRDSKCSQNELLYHLLNFNLRAPVSKPVGTWIAYKPQGIQEEENEELATKVVDGGIYSPLLSRTCGSLALHSNEELSKRLDSWDFGQSVQLDSYKEKSGHMETLATTLWRNLPQLVSDDYDLRKSDAKLAVSAFHLVANAISAVSTDDGTDETGCNNLDVVIERLRGRNIPVALTETLRAANVVCKNVEDRMRGEGGEMQTDDTLSARSEETELELLVGRLWILTGQVGTSLLSCLELLDPVESTRILLLIAETESEEIQAHISIHRLDSLLKTNLDIQPTLSTIHPFVQYYYRRETDLGVQKKGLSEKMAVRPEAIFYEKLKKDLSQYMNGIGSREMLDSLKSRLTECLERLIGGSAPAADAVRLLLLECKSAIESQLSFMKKLEDGYSWYRDIVTPILSSAVKITHGLNILYASLQRNYQKFQKFGSISAAPENLLSEVGSFLRYSPSTTQNDLISVLTGQRAGFHEIIEKSFGVSESTWVVNKLKRNILLSGLIELKDRVYREGRIEEGTRGELEEVFDYFVKAWTACEEEKAIKEAEKESLYRTKTHEGEAPEAEADLESARKMFPTYFNEFESDNMNVDPVTPEESDMSDELLHYVRPEDASFIVESHLHLFRKFAENLVIGLPKVDDDDRDATESFRIRYECVTLLIDQLYPLLDNSLDRNLLISHTMALAVASAPPTLKRKHFNIYFDPHPEEAIKMRGLLDGLVKRVGELLEEWPGHPVLIQILVSVGHLLSFPISSPLMKLLTGLELSLAKCQEWEANAHRGVSISVHLEALSSLVLEWRKMELTGWKECLTAVEERSKANSNKWWFHMYTILMSFLSNAEDGPSVADVGLTVKQFLDGSTLGEFSRRLDMVEAFMLHLLVWRSPEKTGNRDTRKDALVSTFWNLHFQYSQQLPAIRARMNSVRQPIEKKVKDFVKIMRWNDINYWSTRDTVNKSHKTLHRHVKEYETALKENVQSVLGVEQEEVEQGVWDSQGEVKGLDENHLKMFVAPERNLVIEAEIAVSIAEAPTLPRVPKLYTKSRTIVQEIVTKSKHGDDINVIDDLTGEVIKTVDDLQKLQTVGGPNKEKQLSEARQIHSRKRTALAELFKVLQRLGFSYRRGLSSFTMEQAAPATLEIFDVEGALKWLPKRPSDALLTSLWSKCPHYQARRMNRFGSMKARMQQPSKELGPQLIDRLKGFAETIMKFADTLWNQTASTFSSYVAVRRQLQTIQDALTHGPLTTPSAEEILTSQYLGKIEPMSQELETLFETLLIFLRSFKPGSATLAKLSPDSNNGVFSSDEKLSELTTQIEREMAQVRSARKNALQTYSLFKAAKHEQELIVLNEKHCSAVEKSYHTLCSANETTLGLLKDATHGEEICECSPCLSNPFLAPLHAFTDDYHSLQSSFDTTFANLHGGDNSEVSSMAILSIDDVVKSALIGIQEVQKSEIKPSDENAEEDYELSQNHLLDVVGDLDKKVKALRLENVKSVVQKCISAMIGSGSEGVRRILELCTPVLEQFVSLAEFLMLQELSALRTTLKFLSVILGIFGLLAEKGFCLPSELSDEIMKEGTSQFEDIESGGLGEGEGAKDVSDQIESEDQLEGAKKKGEEKEEANEDAKEEDGGIEMSEDFEGKQQDVDKDEDQDEKSDDEDADKEMGETEKGAETLDEEMWGDEEENEEKEDEEKKDEEGKGDGKSGESQTVAKENAPEGDNDDEKEEKGGEEEKKEKEINEMDEQEVDDNQVDPYHGQQGPEPEPEALDLPDDLNLDNGEQADGEEEEATPQENWDIEAPNIEDGKDAEGEEDKEKGEETEDKKAEEEENPADEKTPEDEQPESGDKEKSDEPAADNEPESAQAVSSDDKPSEADTQAAETTSKGSADKVQAEAETDADQGGTNEEQTNKEAEGVGVSQVEQTAGHQGPTSATIESQREKGDEQPERVQKRPGTSDIKRSLAEQSGSEKKRLKTTDERQSAEKEEEEASHDPRADAEMFEHIRDSEKQFDAETVDAATEEQARERPVPREEGEKPEGEDVQMESEDEKEVQESEKKESEKMQGNKPSKQRRTDNNDPAGTEPSEDQQVDVEGETVQTSGASRGSDTEYFTNVDAVGANAGLSQEDIDQIRTELENQVSSWSQHQQWNEIDQSEATEAWLKYETVVGPLSQDLCEQLRLILEPSQASRLRGDYRTGKRLNMRKVIPYIASQFRKDKIWLRRTKPSKRQYQIMLAVDDSSSMADNHSKQLTFESVALISRALSLVEAGELGVVSFGESTRLVHELSDSFTSQSGGRLLHDLTFAQTKTRIGQMVDYVTGYLLQSRNRLTTPSEVAQLLVILSDGRGIFSEGQESVKQAIRRAKESNVFMVFVIIDNPENKLLLGAPVQALAESMNLLPTVEDSILDIRQPIFEGGQLKQIRSYMDQFPFPFYLILRDINSLPVVLSDALRQWFELVTGRD